MIDDVASPRVPNGSLCVVVITYQRPQQLLECLRALQRQTRKPDHVLVVDQSPGDESRQIAAGFTFVEWIDNRANAGRMTTSRNVGLARCTDDLVAFVDDDSLPDPTWAERLVNCFVQHPDAGAVGGRVVEGATAGQPASGPVGAIASNGWIHGNFDAEVEGDPVVSHGVGANMSFRTSVLRDLGGFRDDYPGTSAGEDTDVFLRVGRLGREVRFCSAAVVRHTSAPHIVGRRFDARYGFYSNANHLLLMRRAFGARSSQFRGRLAGPLEVWRQPRSLAGKVKRSIYSVAGLVYGCWLCLRLDGLRRPPLRRDQCLDGPRSNVQPVRRAPVSGARHPLRAAVAALVRQVPVGLRGRDRLLSTIGARVPARDPLAVARMKLGYRMLVDLRSRTEVFAYYTGDYDTHLISAARALTPAGGVVLDVGANVGFWSIGLAGQARVHAFEPVPSNVARIEQNIELNALETAVEVHRLALSDRSTMLSLTLREDFERGAGTGNAAVRIDHDDDHFNALDVRAETLDAWAAGQALDRLDVVKLDVEGHEDLALKGGRVSLGRFRPVLFAELNHDYYRRRGVDAGERFAEVLAGLEYHYLRETDGRWSEVDRFDSPRPLDDLVICPAERVSEVLDVLNRP